MTLNVQFTAMICMVLSGFYLGVALETFRRFSPHWKHRKFLVFFLEICFWLSQTFLLYYVLYRINAGELRVYVFLACLLGFSIYQVTIKTLYKKILEQIIHVILSLYRFCQKIVYALIIVPIKWILYALYMIAQLIISFLLTIISLILTIIKWPFTIIYRLLPQKIKKIISKLAGLYSIIKNTSIKWAKYIFLKRR